MINRMKNLEQEYRLEATRTEQQRGFAEQTREQFETMVTLRHYYTRLYHGFAPFIRDRDLDGLTDYFQKNVAPVYAISVSNRNQLAAIESLLIRGLLDMTLGQVTAVGNILLDFSVSGEIKLPEYIEFEVFEILSNLLDNALNELENQEDGTLQISLFHREDHISIQIANTLENDMDIEAIYSDDQERGQCADMGLAVSGKSCTDIRAWSTTPTRG